MFISCQHDPDLVKEESPKTENDNNSGVIVLGEQLENPYSIENMKRAISELYPTRSVIDLEPTHLYVRFLPSSEEEFTFLKNDTLLDLYSYPLDYEITTGGDYYHDPELSADAITWQYTVVQPDYQFSSIRHEILSELFILDEDKDEDDESISTRNSKFNFVDWESLEDKALEITGNLDDESEGFTTRASKWRPAGTIKVRDDIAGNIPLVGAMVRARRWFTTHTGYTDSEGNFLCNGKFKRDANYSIKWEREYWDIRSGTWGQALYNGPKQSGNWNLTIAGGKSLHYASIHRAAYRHFYGNNLGMRRPYYGPRYNWKICYYDKNGSGDFWGGLGGGPLPDIRIYGNSGSSKLASTVFRTTCHELGHASHCVSMGNVNYWQVSKIIYESWADAVEWALTEQEYEELGSPYTTSNLHEYAHQYWPCEKSSSSVIKDKKEYSSLFIDLVDDYNQSIRNTSSRTYPNDSVTGYSMKSLSSIVKKSYGLSSLKQNLKDNKPTGITDNQIDELFKRYEEIW